MRNRTKKRESRQLLVKAIQEGFHDIGKEIDLETLLNAYQELEKFGVTNRFMTVEIDEESYVIRINGKLWPPYTRESENQVLQVLESKGISTGVLFSGDKFQICRKFEEGIKFSEILKRKDPQEIGQALTSIAQGIATYHNILYKLPILYPITDMFDNVVKKKKNQFEESFPADLKPLIIACYKILSVRGITKDGYVFSHNDLLSTSIFLENVFGSQNVTIVDWEYAALGHWTNDLAQLSLTLTNDQRQFLSDKYFTYRFKVSDNALSADMKMELSHSKFLIGVLNLLWKTVPRNIHKSESQEKIAQLKSELYTLYPKLEVRYSRQYRHEDPPKIVNLRKTIGELYPKHIENRSRLFHTTRAAYERNRDEGRSSSLKLV